MVTEVQFFSVAIWSRSFQVVFLSSSGAQSFFVRLSRVISVTAGKSMSNLKTKMNFNGINNNKNERIYDRDSMMDYSLSVKLFVALSYEGHLHSSTFTSVQGFVNNNGNDKCIAVTVGGNPANFSTCSFLSKPLPASHNFIGLFLLR